MSTCYLLKFISVPFLIFQLRSEYLDLYSNGFVTHMVMSTMLSYACIQSFKDLTVSIDLIHSEYYCLWQSHITQLFHIG